jgi:outer membrane receptor protein involved in Fe transport
MKFLLLFVCFTLLFLNGFSQDEQEQQQIPPQQGKIEVRSNKIYGKLIDQTGKPIEAASVFLYSGQRNSADSLYKAMLSKANGEFNFSNLPSSFHVYKVVVSAVGYDQFEKTISLNNKGGDSITFEKDLGNISLQSYIKQLTNVTISASKPTLQMGIDRKIFNVDKSITSAGGTAVDIMKNIPSVSVDIDGNVELRNTTPQIFIDGRPTILTLDQIPADHIERVELITNPSAKYDASSSGGIINIVLKKNKRIGFNGLASIGGGTPELFNSNVNLNLRQGKFNFFVSGGYNRSGGEAKGKTNRENKDNGVTTDFFNQNSINERSRKFTSVRLGVDYFIDNRNTITISQNFVKGKFGNDETQHQEYLNTNKELQYYGERESNSRSGFDRKSSRLSFKHTFPKADKEFTADIDYNYGNHSDNTDIVNSYFYPDNSVYKPTDVVRNEGSNNNKQLTVQADYTNPINDRSKIETGIRSYYNKATNAYNAFSVNSGQETKLPLSNNYEYDEMINAAYITYSNKTTDETFSYQVGLRAEYSKFDGKMVDSAFKFGYEYPNSFGKLWDALFPSFYLSKKINDDNEIQFNFTRRIRRPRFWQLNPFIDISDPLNLRQGNPQLKPEFINSFEFNYSKNYTNGNFLGVLYFNNNPKDITQYSDTITAAQYQQLNNAAVDPNAILNTWVNANTTNRYGAELTLQHKIGRNFDITPSVNLQYRSVKAKINDLNLDNSGFNWQGKLNMNYKIETEGKSFFNNFSFQFSGEYESPRVIPQGKEIANYDADFAIRKDFLKDKKAALTFAVNDLFNSRKWGTIYDTEQFYQNSYRRWNVRNFRLTFSYKFGDPNFTLGKRGGNRPDDTDD